MHERGQVPSAGSAAAARVRIVPYATIEDLPPSVRRHLPRHAQEIYRAAFNNAWQRYADAGPERREQITHRIAWAAVKRRYRKIGDDWVAVGATDA